MLISAKKKMQMIQPRCNGELSTSGLQGLILILEGFRVSLVTLYLETDLISCLK